MDVAASLIGLKVVSRGLYSGVWYGTVAMVTDDLSVIKLDNAYQIREIRTKNTSGGLARVFEGNLAEDPDIEKVAYYGSIYLRENFEVIPLTPKACELIEAHGDKNT